MHTLALFRTWTCTPSHGVLYILMHNTHIHVQYTLATPVTHDANIKPAQCKKLDIRYGIFLVIFENTPKYTPEYYIEI